MKGWLRHSGIVTAVAAAAIVAGFASCSSENSGPSATKTVDAGAVPSSATATDMSDALPESPGAKSRILDLSSRFVRLPPKVAPDPFAAPGAPTPQLQKQRVLTPGVAEKFVAEGNHARAVLSEAA
ncbi:MAG TPA: hypothetical protein VGJ84_03935, partial [Polyangiaceae bacterium]